jgi:response regulator RpfG family c-di-GMP phosphodiesterase
MKMRLLIVDDEPSVVSALQRSLRSHFNGRLRVEGQTDPLQALARARLQRYDIVLSDLRMPETDGISLLSLLAAVQPHCVRMLLTGTADFATAQRAISDAGVFRYLSKPWEDAELFAHVDAAMLQAVVQGGPRDAQASVTPQEFERRRLEAQEPGITAVEWGPGGEVLMPSLPGDTKL